MGGGRRLSLTSFPCRLAVVVFPLLVGFLFCGGGGEEGVFIFLFFWGGGGLGFFQVSLSCFPCRLDEVFCFCLFICFFFGFCCRCFLCIT